MCQYNLQPLRMPSSWEDTEAGRGSGYTGTAWTVYLIFVFQEKKIDNFSMVLPCISSHFNFLSFEIFKLLLPKMSLQILSFPT